MSTKKDKGRPGACVTRDEIRSRATSEDSPSGTLEEALDECRVSGRPPAREQLLVEILASMLLGYVRSRSCR